MRLYNISASEIIHRRPMGARLFVGIFGLLMVAGGVWIAAYFWPRPEQSYARLPLEVWSRAGFGIGLAAMSLFMDILFLYTAGPDDLILDLITRRYRFRRGFPLLARWQTGSLDDIECLYVKRVQNKSSVTYQTILAWKGQGEERFLLLGDGALATRKNVWLGSEKSEESAMETARQLAERIGVPALDCATARNHFGTNAGKQGTVALVGLILLMMILLLPFVPRLYIERLLDAQGRTTIGTVVEKEYNKSATVRFVYRVNGVEYRSSDQVQRKQANLLSMGDPIQITYLPDYPRTCRTPLSNKLRQAYAILITNGITLALIPIMSLYAYGRAKRRQRLAHATEGK